MTIDKIIFINSEEDYDNLYGILEYDVFDDLESDLARYLFLDNMIIINMIALRKVAREIGFPEKKELNIGLFTTLLHELRHAHQANPLLGSEFNDRSWEELEDDAEEYCSRVFEEIIANEDYFVI
jgi:hypothetical protein